MATSGAIAQPRQLAENCRCDDIGGGVIVRYVEVYAIDVTTPAAPPILLGRFRNGDYATPYNPVNPLPECP